MLSRAVTLGFVIQSVCPEVRFCEKSCRKCPFWQLLVKVSWKMLVLGPWIFGERLMACSKRVQQECQARPSKSEQECQARVSRKSIKKECLEKSVKKECQARVSSKSV